MSSSENTAPDAAKAPVNSFQIAFMVTAVCAIFFTFVLANSEISIEAKTRGFSAIIAGFLIACVTLHFWQNRSSDPKINIELQKETAGVERGLIALEEASKFLAGSIDADDTFRLLSSRIRDIVPFRTIALLSLDDSKLRLGVLHAEGVDAAQLKQAAFEFDDSVVSRSFSDQSIEFGEAVPATINGSMVAIPLLNGIEPFGVLCLYVNDKAKTRKLDKLLFEAIGTRVSPLVLSSFAHEQTNSNALTDPATGLPNERALHLLLENQVAQTIRSRDSRQLTVLALDIKNFDNINQRFGHAAGDRILNFVAQIVKDNLRQMDFLARATGDEFLAVLPTASKEVSHEIIARVHTGFFGRKFKINDTESIEVELTFGWAAFGNDGETPTSLLAAARQRKDQSKSLEPSRVLWFPQEIPH